MKRRKNDNIIVINFMYLGVIAAFTLLLLCQRVYTFSVTLALLSICHHVYAVFYITKFELLYYICVTVHRAVTSRFVFYLSKSRSRSKKIYSSRSRSSSKKNLLE